MDEHYFRGVWSRRTDSDHPKRAGLDVFPVAAGEIQAFLGKTGCRVLDLGCGAGELFDHLVLDRSRYLGVDFSSSMRETFTKRFPGVRVVAGDVATFSIDEQFDFIIVNNVLQYCRPWMTLSCLRNLKPMLAPGGRILLGNVPHRSLRLAYVRRRFSAEREGLLRWVRRLVWGLVVVAFSETDSSVGFWYTPREIGALAEAVGLRCEIFGCLLYPYRFSALLTH